MIDWLLYGLAVIPLLLALGALLRILRGPGSASDVSKGSRTAGWLRLVLMIIRTAVVLSGAAAAAVIVVDTNSFVIIAALMAAAVLLVFVDMLLSEAGRAVRVSVAGGGLSEPTARGRWRWPKRSIAALLVTALLLLLLLCPTGHLVTYPGMTINMNRYAHVEGGAGGGEVNGVLVFDRPAFIADWLYGLLFPLYEFVPTPEDEPPIGETYAQVVAMKNDADGVAAAIAMQKAGVGRGVIAEGVRIVAVLKDAAAVDVLHAGDIIVQLDDQPVTELHEMVGYMESQVKPGSVVRVTLLRNGERLEVDAPTSSADSGEANKPDRAVFGISVQTATRLDVPLAVDYTHYTAHVGGPSHGAMLTIAILDQLTPGGITGDLRVAGTGTIESDGSIGLVGGVPQKAYAVSRMNVDVFFVPALLEEEARYGASELNIVPVETIDDILLWLEQHR